MKKIAIYLLGGSVRHGWLNPPLVGLLLACLLGCLASYQLPVIATCLPKKEELCPIASIRCNPDGMLILDNTPKPAILFRFPLGTENGISEVSLCPNGHFCPLDQRITLRDYSRIKSLSYFDDFIGWRLFGISPYNQVSSNNSQFCWGLSVIPDIKRTSWGSSLHENWGINSLSLVRKFYQQPRAIFTRYDLNIFLCDLSSFPRLNSLPSNHKDCYGAYNHQRPIWPDRIPQAIIRLLIGAFFLCGGFWVINSKGQSFRLMVLSLVLMLLGVALLFLDKLFYWH